MFPTPITPKRTLSMVGYERGFWWVSQRGVRDPGRRFALPRRDRHAFDADGLGAIEVWGFAQVPKKNEASRNRRRRGKCRAVTGNHLRARGHHARAARRCAQNRL